MDGGLYANNPALIRMLGRTGQLAKMLEGEQTGKGNLATGVVLTVQNATRIVLSPISALGGATRPRRLYLRSLALSFFRHRPSTAAESLLASEARECALSCIVSGFAEFFLNAQQLVVLCNTVTARRSTRLDLAAVGSNGKISNRGVFGFT